jgi:hypothetical protein
MIAVMMPTKTRWSELQNRHVKLPHAPARHRAAS